MNNDILKAAAAQIEVFRNNAVIMDFVRGEALKQVAADYNEKTGRHATPAAIELISCRDKTIADRIEKYIELGLVGCLQAKYS